MHAQDLQPLEDRRRRVHRYAGLLPSKTESGPWWPLLLFLAIAVATIFGALYFRSLAEPTVQPTIEVPAPTPLPAPPPDAKTGVVR